MKTHQKIAVIITVAFACFTNVDAFTITIDQIEYECGYPTYVKKVPTNYVGGIAFPETIEASGKTYTLTEIGDNACKDCKKITAVQLPKTIVKIGSNAFYGCEKLCICNLPENLEYIGSGAFTRCNITEIEFPKSLTTLGSRAYESCPITNVFIPNTLTKIYEFPFSKCSDIETFVVEEGNPQYDSRNNCNAIIETSTQTLIHACYNTTIPDGIKVIGGGAFLHSSKIKQIILPSSIKKIEGGAFSDCINLEQIHLPEGLEVIGNAFENCDNLKSIHIPSTVKEIDWGVELDSKDTNIFPCTNLETISVAEGNSVYDSREGCNAIIRTSDNTLLSGCMNTIIPSSVEKIGHKAFYNCTALTTIEIPGNVQIIGPSAFRRCQELTSVVFGEGTATIDGKAFMGCSKLSKILFSNTIREIKMEAFEGCYSLTSLTIPEGVKHIGWHAFYGCCNIETLYIHIREEDFNDGGIKIDDSGLDLTSPINLNNSLKYVYCFSEKPFNISPEAFYKNSYNSGQEVTLYVPIGSSELYKNDENWKLFISPKGTKNIVEEFDVTGIENIKILSYPQEIYSIDGIKMPYTKKGVNIINGKKVFM